ncbi:peptidylprolyl isomerase, partial [Staphylococcus aureus]
TPDPPRPMGPFPEDTFPDDPHGEIETNKGTFTIELFALDAPLHTADFIGHVKAGFYDGLIWHRVVPNFVAQGGDPD